MLQRIFCTLAVGLAPFASQAADSSWNSNAAGSWNDPSKWTSGVPGSTSVTNSTDIATFSFTLSAARIVTVDANRNIGGISFENTGAFAYTLSSGNILLSNGGVIQTLAANGNHTDTISAPIAIQGVGGSATYAANASSSSSILRIGGITTGVSTVGNTTTLYLAGSNTADNTVAGAIQNGSAGGNVAVVKDGIGKWILSGGNTFTGDLTVNNGILRTIAATNNALGAGTSALTLNGGELQLASAVSRNYGRGTTVSNNSTIISDSTVVGAGFTYSLASLSIGANTLTVNGGSNVTSGTAGITFTGATTLTGAATFNVLNNGASTTLLTLNSTLNNGGHLATFQGTGNSRIAGIVSGSGGLVKAGSGTLTLNAENTYTGGTTINEGTLKIGEGGTTGSIAGNVNTTSATATLAIDRSNTHSFDGVISGSGRLLKAGLGTLTLSAVNTYSGGTIIENGRVNISSDANLGNAVGNITFNNGTNIAQLAFTADMTSNRNIIINGDQIRLSPEGEDREVTLNGQISGAGGIDKRFVGTLILAGNNSYAGGTVITTGLLAVENTVGSATGSGAVTVSAGGGLGGSGIIAPGAGNNVVVSGLLSPGNNDADVLTFNLSGASKLDFASGSKVELTLGTASDSIAFTTAGDWLSGSSNAVLELTLGGGFSYANVYTIFSNATTVGFDVAGVTGYDTVNYNHVFSQVGSDYVLSFQVVPEPSVIALVGIGAWMLLLRRRRIG